MLHVILHILAVIGIILLCILGLILLLLLLVLFVPIRYRIKGSRYGEDVSLFVKVSYLLHMLTVRFQYKEPGSIIVRLFGIKVFDSGRLFGEKEAAETETETENEIKQKEKETEQQEQEKALQTVQSKQKQKSREQELKTQKTQASQIEKEEAEVTWEKLDKNETEPADRREEAKPLGESKAEGEKSETGTKEKTPGLIEKIQYTITSFCDKIKNIYAKLQKICADISYYKDILTANENKAFFIRVKERIFKILKSIRPRKLVANLHIGTGSPDTTGYLVAVYGMLLPVLGNHITMEADFENAVWEGDVFAKGRITIFTIVLQACRVYFDKQLRIFIKEIKREA